MVSKSVTIIKSSLDSILNPSTTTYIVSEEYTGNIEVVLYHSTMIGRFYVLNHSIIEFSERGTLHTVMIQCVKKTLTSMILNSGLRTAK